MNFAAVETPRTVTLIQSAKRESITSCCRVLGTYIDVDFCAPTLQMVSTDHSDRAGSDQQDSLATSDVRNLSSRALIVGLHTHETS